MTGFNAWLIVDVKIVPAVQEERQRNKEKGEGDVESTSPANADMPVEKVLEAELAVEPQTDTYIDAQVTMIDLLLTGFLFDLILYIPSTIFQLCRDRPSWVEPVLS